MRQLPKLRLARLPSGAAALVSSLLLALSVLPASAADPFASNNGLYPDAGQWQGPYRSLNYDYPQEAGNGWLETAPRVPLGIGNAAAYVSALKAYLAPTMEGMINTPNEWDPAINNWYGMIWQGAGSTGPNGKTDPTSGQEAILGAFSGQVIKQATSRIPA